MKQIKDENILNIIQDALDYMIDRDEITYLSNFNDIDIDGLDKAQIIFECEKNYGEIEDDDILYQKLFENNIVNFINVLKEYYNGK